VRKDLGYIPLVTPTSQIVGTQSVINVLSGERYKVISEEAAGILKGEYGATPAAVNHELQQRVLEGAEPITCRPADLIDNEMATLTGELEKIAKEEGITLAKEKIDDVLIYAQFPQVGLEFLKNRGNPDAFEPHPGEVPVASPTPVVAPGGPENYRVKVDGRTFDVQVEPVTGTVIASNEQAPRERSDGATTVESIKAPLAGKVVDIPVAPGDQVSAGQVIVVIEAMKMETQIRCSVDGHIDDIKVAKGDTVRVNQVVLTIS
jgi:oxaloacetate decarboxylase alpha subunit